MPPTVTSDVRRILIATIVEPRPAMYIVMLRDLVFTQLSSRCIWGMGVCGRRIVGGARGCIRADFGV